ncbi:ribbon-helix-helix protein, CopG family [Cyanobium sp. ATX 6F1]|uniref:ribbon-helix-helix protein, CopG family n=1 Tax=unclassified Cyanobium TaxID=2627006 RepID=UPI0020CBEF67|nr:ribbon-helix-helix protein, CopG family [Cyanobium sp. ATX 6F1]MCP9915123.1 ribbon-helix-helix protein, CopG family [Cyanobium sp. ATX 6F1]
MDEGLDPARFPRRLELEISAEAMELLIELAQRTGRSINEVALELLDGQIRRLQGD